MTDLNTVETAAKSTAVAEGNKALAWLKKYAAQAAVLVPVTALLMHYVVDKLLWKP